MEIIGPKPDLSRAPKLDLRAFLGKDAGKNFTHLADSIASKRLQPTVSRKQAIAAAICDRSAPRVNYQ